MKKMSKVVEKRKLMLEMMHEYLINEVSDENAFFTWIIHVPDEATEDDFIELAEDDADWKECVKLFGRLLDLE